MASNQVNLVEGEQAVGLSDALMDRAAEEATEKNSEGTFQVCQSRKKKRKDRESLEGNGDNNIALINKRPRDAAPDAESTAEEDTQPVDKTKATAVVKLTTEGYDGVVMEQPKDSGNLTKVFIAPYDRLLDPELLLDDDRVVWAKRHVVRGERKKSVVALVRGEVPEKLHVLGNGYRRVHKYIEQPIQCYNYSRWNPKAWSCRQPGMNPYLNDEKSFAGQATVALCCLGDINNTGLSFMDTTPPQPPTLILRLH
ncbi:hypothetical protein Pmani_031554 [Petrolisthes manimaculis]|uniref:Uncharacterized protein n=1 Tax=Petrolisthes manimaculis TaxID=1843537 RepID=A0AAE1TUR2_9EUCA|nr:hypothetical protein Pmani_031554 [Petrolisthes manimaculis]